MALRKPMVMDVTEDSYPVTPVDTSTDQIPAFGFYAQSGSSFDTTVGIYRDSSGNLILKDAVAGSLTLDSLVNDDAAALLTKIKTVDGAGSGLDADTLDGNEASAFALSGHNHAGVYQPAGSYQPLDGDLTAIANLTGTLGLLKKTAADTWTLDTNAYSLTNHNHDGTYQPAGSYEPAISPKRSAFNVDFGVLTGTVAQGNHDHAGVYQPVGSYLTANQSITLSGDATGTGTTAITVTLKNTGSAGTYTKVTTDATGRVTAGTSMTQADVSSSLGFLPPSPSGTITNATNAANTAITNDTTTNSAHYITFASATSGNAAQKVSNTKLTFNPSTGILSASAITSPTVTVIGTVSGTTGNFLNLNKGGVAVLTANQSITLSGDATGTGTTAITVTLKNTGSAGTYTKVTTDATGRVTAGTSMSQADVSSSLGYLPVSKNGDVMSGDLTINGSLNATSKSFYIDHPTKKGWKLRYGSLESPYHGIRLTGEGKVTNGRCQITLPPYMKGLVRSEGINIQLTNWGHSVNLWVENPSPEGFVVRSGEGPSAPSRKFFWTFSAIRKDVPDMVVEEEA